MITVGASSVTVSRGRGSAKTSIDVDFSRIERWARRNQMDTGRLMTRSFGRACSGLKKKFYSVMQNGGGVCGVPKFTPYEAFTRDLHDARGWQNRRLGGLLADKASIVAFRSNGWQIVGWPDKFEKTAKKFQEGTGGSYLSDFENRETRAYWHRCGVSEVPRAYVHNPRPTMTEFGEYVKVHIDDWAKGAFYKELARQMQKAGEL